MSSLTPNYSFILPGVNDPTDQDLWGGYLNSNFSSLDTILKSVSDVADDALAKISIPLGAIVPYAGLTEPDGFLFPYGQAISRTTYADLFTLIGTTYGSGDGSTTFNIPDGRGRVFAGKDDMGGTSADRLTGLSGGVDGDVLGASGGQESVTLTIDMMPAHHHHSGMPHISDGQFGADGTFASKQKAGFGSATFATDSTKTDEVGGGNFHNNVQPTFVANCIMRVL